jgi:hypothetical protein
MVLKNFSDQRLESLSDICAIQRRSFNKEQMFALSETLPFFKAHLSRVIKISFVADENYSEFRICDIPNEFKTLSN